MSDVGPIVGVADTPPPGAPAVAGPAKHFGLATGVGLVAANMIGAGVFLSAGFMAQTMGPAQVLLSWVVGGALALCGVAAYGALAAAIPQSGGEYRYLSTLLHPALGYLAGWGSLLLGFAAPIAIDALAAAAFLQTLIPGLPDARILGTLAIVVLTLVHAWNLRGSRWAQDALALLKVGLVGAFAIGGLSFGTWAWPTWEPPAPGGGVVGFLENQFWVAFAFSGWNAAIYASGEFRDPSRQVPRAMAVGTVGVTLFYLLVNWVFVANLTPSEAAVVTEQERITLGHVLLGQMVGPSGAVAMSALAVVAFTAAMSAMTVVGPRVCSEMARDGFLPGWLVGRHGRPPVGSLLLQGGLAIGILWSASLHDVVQTAASILMVFTGLAAIAVFRITTVLPNAPKPGVVSKLGAAAYVGVVAWILWCGFREAPGVLVACGAVALAGLGAWAASPGSRR